MITTQKEIILVTAINEEQIKELESYYNELDIGIIIINKSLDFVFLNAWFGKRLAEEFKSLWELRKAFNLTMLYGSDKVNLNNKDKIERIIGKVIKDKSLIVLSQAFHEWVIPLKDKRFPDGKMRQTCIVQPCSHYKNMALVQIKDESDTVLKSRNLRQIKELIKNKNIDLIRLNQELTDREKSVKQKSKMEAIGRMAGGIAHDFNNYLFIILGNLELLMNDIPATDSNYSCLEDIQKAAISAKSIIHEIATFRRAEINESEINESEEEYLNIDTVIRAQVALIKSMISRTISIDYSYHSSNNECFVRASSSQLQRIFFNIAINAVDAIYGDSFDPNKMYEELPINSHINITLKPIVIENRDDWNNICDLLKKERGESNYISVLYEFAMPGKYVALTISDSGHGITPDNLEKIFDPYFTTKPIGKGSGVGLSVVLGIVKHLRGTIHVQSEVDKGTSFTVFLPSEFKI